jgi:putative ABC transport system permease protein
MLMLKKSTPIIENICYVMDTRANVENENNLIERVNIFGPSEGFTDMQPLDFAAGRYFSASEIEQGSPVSVIGYENAELLFGKAERAVGRTIKVKNRETQIIGVIKKQGKSIIGGWEFDQSVIFPHRYFKRIFIERYSSPVIMAQGRAGVSIDAFKDELKGQMRKIRRLGPKEADDFALNAVSDFSKSVSSFFSSVSMGGWFIGVLSLIVGIFSIANIMFVTVRERTSIIGLKKAIGAKRRTILAEFLLESSFICLLGGAIGLLLVFILTFLLSQALSFPVFISFKILSLALTLCIGIGILAGIIPASIAARLDPVVAIRSK